MFRCGVRGLRLRGNPPQRSAPKRTQTEGRSCERGRAADPAQGRQRVFPESRYLGRTAEEGSDAVSIDKRSCNTSGRSDLTCAVTFESTDTGATLRFIFGT